MRRKTRNADNLSTKDSFQNLNASLGMGANNLISKSTYTTSPITRNRTVLENAYRTSFVVGLAVDCVAEDMTKKNITINSALSPEDINELMESICDLNIWNSLCEVIKWSRLYGGAVGYLMIDGQDPSTPLDVSTINVGQFKGILPLDRWQLNTNPLEVITELGEDYGLPEYYELYTQQAGISQQNIRIHYSRILRFTGIDLPFQQRFAENLWGESEIERIWDRLIAYDSTAAGVAQLVYKAHLRTLKVKGFRNIVASGGPALDGLTKMVENMRLMQSNEGITIVDADDTFDINNYSFGGLTDVLDSFLEQLSGALQIPLVRLLGQSPKGFSTGDTDLAIYASNIHRRQENKLRKPIKKLLEILSYSILGKELPKGTNFIFNSFLDLDEKEDTDKMSTVVNSIISLVNSGVITKDEARKELKQINNFYTNIV